MSNLRQTIMKKLSRTLKRFRFLNQTMHSLCKLVKNVKYMLHDYQGIALQNIHKIHLLNSNNTSILRSFEHVETMLMIIKKAWKTLTTLMFLNQTMHSLCRFVKRSKRYCMILKEPWRTLTRLMFLNQTMHSLYELVERSKGC